MTLLHTIVPELRGIALSILAAMCFVWTFWGVYVLVMGLYRVQLAGKLSRASYVLGLPWLWLGLAADVVCNLTLAGLLFLDPPRELLVTSRLKRYMSEEAGNWRGRWAEAICSKLLDPFDPSGDHC